MKMRYRDLAARVFDDEIRFPAFLPSVYGRNVPNTEGILVNVYRIWTDRNYRTASSKDIHSFLSFNGFVLPESGWKQIDKYGDEDVTNEDLVHLQERMGFPVVAPLPAGRVEDAIINAGLAREMTEKSLFLEIPASWTEKEVLAFVEATKEWAWGYGTHSDDPEFLEMLLRVVPRSKKIAVLGIHHPAIIPVLAAMGADVFSSGAHARYASRGLYITDASIRPLSEMEELPCSCNACENRDPDDLERNRELLERHNLNAFLLEVKRTRNAIAEGRLYEYARRRAMTHPDIYRKFLFVVRSDWVLENLPFPKQNSIYLFENEFRPEIELGKRLARERGANIDHLAFTYPFGQTYPPMIESRPEPEDVVRAVFRYQYGIDVDVSSLRWELRKGIPRNIFMGETYIGLIRFEDGFFVPSIEGARWLKELLPPPQGRIVVDEDGVQQVRNKRTPLTDHVLDVDPGLRPNMEVIIVDENDGVIATGKSVLTAREVAEIPRVPAVKVRHRAV